MLTLRKMFSNSLAASATRQEDTGTSRLIAIEYNSSCLLQAGRGKATNNLGNGCYDTVRVPGVFSLRRKGEMKIDSRFQV